MLLRVVVAALCAISAGCAAEPINPLIRTTAALDHQFSPPSQSSVVVTTASVFEGKVESPMLHEQQLVADAQAAAAANGFSVRYWHENRPLPECDYVFVVSEDSRYKDYESLEVVATPTFSSGTAYSWSSGRTASYSGSSTTYNTVPVTRTMYLHLLAVDVVPRDRLVNAEDGTKMGSLAVWSASWTAVGKYDAERRIAVQHLLDRWGITVEEKIPFDQPPAVSTSRTY